MTNSIEQTDENNGAPTQHDDEESVLVPLKVMQLMANHLNYAWSSGAFLKVSRQEQLAVLANLENVLATLPPTPGTSG